METTALQIQSQEQQLDAYSPAQVTGQVALIQQIMRDVMKEKEHFGTIPGCGDKKVLFKSGAEKLSFTFRLSPEFDVETVELGGGHREYRVKTTIRSINSGRVLGQGVGSCSTMESKYRYRSGEGLVTNVPVPKAYWETWKSDRPKASSILKHTANDAGIAGDKFGTKKDAAGGWMISTFGERVEHDNPPDHWNTALKMAKKRSHVDGILTATAASDIFTQDLEDIKANEESNAAKPIDVEVMFPARKDVPAPANAGAPEDWRSVQIHFGKNKGTTLGQLAPAALNWYMEKWEPREYPEGSGKFSDVDLRLKAALNAAEVELNAQAGAAARAGQVESDQLPM